MAKLVFQSKFLNLIITFVIGIGCMVYSTTGWCQNYFPVTIENKWGYIDSEGNKVCNPKFDFAFPFTEGRAAVYQNNSGWKYIDTSFTFISKRSYDFAQSYSEGVAVVIQDGSYLIIDRNENIIRKIKTKKRQIWKIHDAKNGYIIVEDVSAGSSSGVIIDIRSNKVLKNAEPCMCDEADCIGVVDDFVVYFDTKSKMFVMRNGWLKYTFSNEESLIDKLREPISVGTNVTFQHQINTDTLKEWKFGLPQQLSIIYEGTNSDHEFSYDPPSIGVITSGEFQPVYKGGELIYLHSKKGEIWKSNFDQGTFHGSGRLFKLP